MDLINDAISEPEWMEKVTEYGNFRVWHLIFFGVSGVLSISKFQSRIRNRNRTTIDCQILNEIFCHFRLCHDPVIMLCCCFRFRIPRTKQDIEADYQRRIIAKKFRERLANIKNSEMDDMDLQKGNPIRHVRWKKCQWLDS